MPRLRDTLEAGSAATTLPTAFETPLSEPIGSVADFDQMRVPELKDELRARHLPVSGTRDELVRRLREDDHDNTY